MKARQLLPEDDEHAFAFYLNEYRTARLSLTSFFNVLLDLLNTPEKILLFHEIRSAILPRDLTKFDEWIEQIEHTRLQRQDTDGSKTKHDKLSLYSYKSSDSSTTTNSWLGLFENGDEKHSKMNFKYRHRQDALPHPPKDFLDDSLNSGSKTREFGTRPRDPSFDLPPPPLPVFAFNSTGTPGNINRFEQTSSQIGLSENNTPFYKKSSDKTTEISGERNGHFPSSVDYRGMSEKFMSKDEYPPEDSTYDDDGLYTPVDYKGPKRASGSAVHNLTMLNASGAEDDLYTSVDNMEFDMKHESVSTTSRDNDLRSNGFIDEETEIPIYAAVDKTRISPKVAKKNFLVDSEFEIPPPIPDRLVLETGDFQESSDSADNIHSQQNTHDFRNNTSSRHEVSLATGQINDRNESTTNGVIETNVASFPERVDKFNGESSTGQNHKNSIVQKSKKVKKKSKPKVAEIEEPVDDGQPFVVELTKHSSNLGLSVRGGTDTDCKEIRIKSVKDEDTVAGSCPLIQPGQIILGVDEKSLQNVTSGIAAMAIRQAFHSDKTVLKLILQNSS